MTYSDPRRNSLSFSPVFGLKSLMIVPLVDAVAKIVPLLFRAN